MTDRRHTTAGEGNGRARLTERDVRKILAWPKFEGYRIMLADLYGVSPRTIEDIRARRSWTHLTIEEDR